jgi:hypothetical protein
MLAQSIKCLQEKLKYQLAWESHDKHQKKVMEMKSTEAEKPSSKLRKVRELASTDLTLILMSPPLISSLKRSLLL